MPEPLSPGDLALRVPRGYRAEPAVNVQADHYRRPIRRFHGCLLFVRNHTGQYTVRRETAFHAITNRSPLPGLRSAFLCALSAAIMAKWFGLSSLKRPRGEGGCGWRVAIHSVSS